MPKLADRAAFTGERTARKPELAPAVEKGGEGHLPVRPVENVFSFDLDPGKLAPFASESGRACA